MTTYRIQDFYECRTVASWIHKNLEGYYLTVVECLHVKILTTMKVLHFLLNKTNKYFNHSISQSVWLAGTQRMQISIHHSNTSIHFINTLSLSLMSLKLFTCTHTRTHTSTHTHIHTCIYTHKYTHTC